MKCSFSAVETPVACKCFSVSCIYHLEADATYHVHHMPLCTKTHVCLWTMKGTGILKVEDTTHVLSGGTVLVFKADSAMFEYFTQGEEWCFWWFEFTAADPIQPFVARNVAGSAMLERICSNTLEALLQQKNSLASSLFGAFYETVISPLTNAEGSHAFLTARNYIHAHLKEATVSATASTAHISTRMLLNLFMENTGLSPKAYIVSLKLETCKYMLGTTSKTIAEISEELGFSSQFHLSRSFKEKYAMSPQAYRKNKKA